MFSGNQRRVSVRKLGIVLVFVVCGSVSTDYTDLTGHTKTPNRNGDDCGRCVGPNPHTQENLIVYIPREKILFQGDLSYFDFGAPFPPKNPPALNQPQRSTQTHKLRKLWHNASPPAPDRRPRAYEILKSAIQHKQETLMRSQPQQLSRLCY